MIRDSYYGRPYARIRPNSVNQTNGKNYFLDQAFVKGMLTHDLPIRFIQSISLILP